MNGNCDECGKLLIFCAPFPDYIVCHACHSKKEFTNLPTHTIAVNQWNSPIYLDSVLPVSFSDYFKLLECVKFYSDGFDDEGEKARDCLLAIGEAD
jgi:hypothetical protein